MELFSNKHWFLGSNMQQKLTYLIQQPSSVCIYIYVCVCVCIWILVLEMEELL